MYKQFQQFCKPIIHQLNPDLPSLSVLIDVASKEKLFIQPVHSLPVSIDLMPKGKMARKVVTRSAPRSTSKVPSRKNNCMIHCESTIEVDAAIEFESHALVNSYFAQPAIITYLDETNMIRKHFPDFLVILENGNRLLVEVKGDDEAIDPEVIWRTQHLNAHLRLIGFPYILVCRGQIPTYEMRFQNRMKGAA